MIRTIVCFAFTLFLTTTYAQKRKLNASLKNSSVFYQMSHPLHDWDGTSKNYKAIIAFNDGTSQVEAAAVVIPVKSFDSGNSNRDSHALDALEALKYPNITFTCSEIAYDGRELVLNGKLNFHGVENSLTIYAHQEISNNFLIVSGKFEVDMTNYEVKPPDLMGMSTKKEIRLEFKFSFDLK